MIKVGLEEQVKHYSKLDANAGAAATITIAADAEEFHAIRGVQWSYSDTPAAGSYISIAFGTTPTVVWKQFITAGGPGFFEWPWKEGLNNNRTANEQCVITLSAPGGAITTTLNVQAS